MAAKMIRVCLMTALVVMLLPSIAFGSSASGAGGSGDGFGKVDNKADPITTKQLELRKNGLEKKLAGKTKDKVVQLAKGQYVQLERRRRERDLDRTRRVLGPEAQSAA